VGRDITLAATADLRALANLQVRMCWAQVKRLGMLGCERYLKEIVPDGPLATPDWELTQTFDAEVVDLVEESFCTAVDLRHAREELALFGRCRTDAEVLPEPLARTNRPKRPIRFDLAFGAATDSTAE
jgi:hypothetical protein